MGYVRKKCFNKGKCHLLLNDLGLWDASQELEKDRFCKLIKGVSRTRKPIVKEFFSFRFCFVFGKALNNIANPVFQSAQSNNFSKIIEIRMYSM